MYRLLTPLLVLALATPCAAAEPVLAFTPRNLDQATLALGGDTFDFANSYDYFGRMYYPERYLHEARNELLKESFKAAMISAMHEDQEKASRPLLFSYDTYLDVDTYSTEKGGFTFGLMAEPHPPMMHPAHPEGRYTIQLENANDFSFLPMDATRAAGLIEHEMDSGYSRKLKVHIKVELLAARHGAESICYSFNSQGTCVLDARIVALDVLSRSKNKKGNPYLIYAFPTAKN